MNSNAALATANYRYGYAGNHVPMDRVLAAEAQYGKLTRKEKRHLKKHRKAVGGIHPGKSHKEAMKTCVHGDSGIPGVYGYTGGSARGTIDPVFQAQLAYARDEYDFEPDEFGLSAIAGGVVVNPDWIGRQVSRSLFGVDLEPASAPFGEEDEYGKSLRRIRREAKRKAGRQEVKQAKKGAKYESKRVQREALCVHGDDDLGPGIYGWDDWDDEFGLDEDDQYGIFGLSIEERLKKIARRIEKAANRDDTQAVIEGLGDMKQLMLKYAAKHAAKHDDDDEFAGKTERKRRRLRRQMDRLAKGGRRAKRKGDAWRAIEKGAAGGIGRGSVHGGGGEPGSDPGGQVLYGIFEGIEEGVEEFAGAKGAQRRAERKADRLERKAAHRERQAALAEHKSGQWRRIAEAGFQEDNSGGHPGVWYGILEGVEEFGRKRKGKKPRPSDTKHPPRPRSPTPSPSTGSMSALSEGPTYGYAGGHVPMDNILRAEAEYAGGGRSRRESGGRRLINRPGLRERSSLKMGTGTGLRERSSLKAGPGSASPSFGYAGGHVPMDNILRAEAEYGWGGPAVGPGWVGDAVAESLFGEFDEELGF